jgi:hypothetical protein
VESIRKMGGEPLDFIQLVLELVSGDYFRDFIRVNTPDSIWEELRPTHSSLLCRRRFLLRLRVGFQRKNQLLKGTSSLTDRSISRLLRRKLTKPLTRRVRRRSDGFDTFSLGGDQMTVTALV